MTKLRPEVEEAIKGATEKIADGIILNGNDGGFKMHGTPRALLALVELGARLAVSAKWGVPACAVDQLSIDRILQAQPGGGGGAMIDEAKLSAAIGRERAVIYHSDQLREARAAGVQMNRSLFHRDADVQLLIAAAREREQLYRERDEARNAWQVARTALEAQRQATEEARRELAVVEAELTSRCGPAANPDWIKQAMRESASWSMAARLIAEHEATRCVRCHELECVCGEPR